VPAKRCTRVGAALVAAVLVHALAVVGPGGVGGVSPAAAAAAGVYVKYYEVVGRYGGKPETLATIAARLLGDGGRAAEMFDLNAGRTQPDGGKLTDPDSLRRGWLLVLPWDAVGDGVRYGELPASRARGGPTGQRSPRPRGAPSSAPPGSASPAPAVSVLPSLPARSAGDCSPPRSASTSSQQWAQERLAPQEAWASSRGDGVVVAVVDSGVDGSVPELRGRVLGGADVVTGSANGNVDCLGTGTAMAGLIAGESPGGGPLGVAPGAAIMPVRIAGDAPRADPADQARAIDVAVSAGAGVIALGSLVDLRDLQVQAAVTNAVDHDVVVVAGAPTQQGAGPPAEVVTVGAMDVDGQPAEDYLPGTVDVVAPGVDVASVAPGGGGEFRVTGVRYAVAIVAGVAALVRAVGSDISAADAAERVTRSAAQGAGSVPDPASGWGLVNPAAAVRVAAHHAPSATQTARPGRGLPTQLLALLLAVVLAAAGLLLLRLRRSARPDPDAEYGHEDYQAVPGMPSNRQTIPLPGYGGTAPPGDRDG
jgi:membrane-anchored mycosin MYCP